MCPGALGSRIAQLRSQLFYLKPAWPSANSMTCSVPPFLSELTPSSLLVFMVVIPKPQSQSREKIFGDNKKKSEKWEYESDLYFAGGRAEGVRGTEKDVR